MRRPTSCVSPAAPACRQPSWRVLISRFYGRNHMIEVIVLMGCLVALQSAAGAIWGYNIRAFPSPFGTAPLEIAGYSFPRKNWFQGRWIRHLWGGDRIVRLFLKERGRMTPAAVHESVEVDGVVKDLDVPIEHYTESDLSKILIKIDHYSTLGAREAFESGRRSSIYGACGRAALTFFQDYFLRLGFLDGPQGLTLSVTDAVNKFCKYAKLSALHKQVRSPERSR